jgi:hypothetical protein
VLVGGIGNDVDGPGDVAGVATVTTQGYDAAGEPKRLVLLEDAGHDIAGHEDEFVELVVAWAVPLLAAG